MLERTVEQYLVDQLKLYGARCAKVVDKSRNGGPDREVQWPHLGIDKVETKKPKKSAEAHQTRYHEHLALCGQPVYLLDTKEKVNRYIFARKRSTHDSSLFSVPCGWIR